MGDSGGSSEDQMPIGMQTVKTVLMKFQMGTRTLLKIRMEVIPVTFWQKTCLYFWLCSETLWAAGFKGDEQINLAEKISR
jgi:hypothetical protein